MSLLTRRDSSVVMEMGDVRPFEVVHLLMWL